MYCLCSESAFLCSTSVGILDEAVRESAVCCVLFTKEIIRMSANAYLTYLVRQLLLILSAERHRFLLATINIPDKELEMVKS